MSRQVAILQTVNARLPGWRTRSPRRVQAARWPARDVVVDGHGFAVPILPAVGVRWFSRGPLYWARRVQLIVLFLIGAAVTVALDVGFVQSARETSVGALVWWGVVLAALAVAALVFYWRPDLYVTDPAPGGSRLPVPLRVVGLVVGLLGLCLTPAYLLSVVADLLPRFPAQERLAWAQLADQQPDGWGGSGAPAAAARGSRSSTSAEDGAGRSGRTIRGGDALHLGRGLLDEVEVHVRAWRASRTARVSAPAWPTLPARVEGREVDLAVLPGVRTDWFARGSRYRRRRTGLVVYLLAVAAAFGWLDVAFIRLVARAGSATSFTVAVVVLFAAGAVFALRPDVFGSRRRRWWTPLAWVLLVVGAVGRLATPGWSLVVAVRQLPRFPVAERLAWLALVDQLAPSPHRSPAGR